MVTNVAVNKNFIAKLGSPYSGCVTDLTVNNPVKSPIMRSIFDDYRQVQYSQDFCLDVCLQMAAKKKCDCFSPTLPLNSDFNLSTICASLTQSACYFAVAESFVADPTVYCSDYCPSECNKATYTSEVNTAQYLTNWFWNFEKSYFANYTTQSNSTREVAKQQLYNKLSNLSLDQARSNIVKINIYLTKLGYTKTTESPLYSFNTLLGALGGVLGSFSLK